MDYKELSELYHKDASSDREQNAQRMLQERLRSESTFDLRFETSCGSLFIATPREMSLLLETVLRRERKVSKLMQGLPGIAGDEVLRSLAFDEVVNNNAIEDIHSTRRQIETALQSRSDSGAQPRRFREFATMYLDMTFGSPEPPRTVEDIRAIYDQVMEGEDLLDPPDGVLFRKDTVHVSNGVKAVHVGLHPEQKIIEAMELMLYIVSSEEIPALYSALAAHYIFEYAHPFYDGNGRTGRYLLSLFLEEPLSKPTALSLSRAIAEDKTLYYRAFRTVEDPLNRGELTFFVFFMLELIMQAQSELVDRLERCRERYDLLCESMEQFSAEGWCKEKELTFIFALAQKVAFGMFPDMSVNQLSDMVQVGSQQTRKYLARLEERGIAAKVRGRNPVTFALSDSFKAEVFPFLQSA